LLCRNKEEFKVNSGNFNTHCEKLQHVTVYRNDF